MVARYLLMAASQVMGFWRNVAGEMETFVDTVEHRDQNAAHQPHVMVHGQPEHAAVLVLYAESLMDGADVGNEVPVTDHDALWLAGRAGGVLEHGKRVGCDGRFAPSLGQGIWNLVGGEP